MRPPVCTTLVFFTDTLRYIWLEVHLKHVSLLFTSNVIMCILCIRSYIWTPSRQCVCAYLKKKKNIYINIYTYINKIYTHTVLSGWSTVTFLNNQEHILLFNIIQYILFCMQRPQLFNQKYSKMCYIEKYYYYSNTILLLITPVFRNHSNMLI